MILAIDPGKDKTGIAICDAISKTVVQIEIVSTETFSDWLSSISRKYSFRLILLGNGTHSRDFLKILKKVGPQYPVELIEEAYSTLEARSLYFKIHPPRGWRKLLPQSLQTPDRPIDDLVAVVLLQRYLGEIPKISK